jgi:hypothetical protein
MNLPCGHATEHALAQLVGPYLPGRCKVCWLYLNDALYRGLFDRLATPPATPSARSLPCIHLGGIVGEAGCGCAPGTCFACALHHKTTLVRCRTCPDYQAD